MIRRKNPKMSSASAATEEAVSLYPPGTVVSIVNVNSKPELNGKPAVVVQFDETKSRFLVQVKETKEKISLKSKCLLLKVVKEEEKEEEKKEEKEEKVVDEYEEKEVKRQKVGEEETKVEEEEKSNPSSSPPTKKEAKTTKTKKTTTKRAEKSGADEADKRRKYAQKSLWFTPWNEKNNFDSFDPPVPVDEDGKYTFPNEDESTVVSLKEKYKAMKTEELKKWCKANGYATGGKKE